MSPEHQPTFNQLHEQRNAGHAKSDVLVRRTPDKDHPDGWISTGRYTGVQIDGKYQVEVGRTDNKKPPSKWVSAEALTDEKQAELANELADARGEKAQSTYEDYPFDEVRKVVSVSNESGQSEQWLISGEGVDGQGREFFRLTRGDGEEYLSKDVTAEEMRAITAERNERYKTSQRVEAGMAHVAVEQMVAEPVSAEKKKTAEEELLEQFNKLKAGLDERDQIAFFQYATALYPHEETSARRKMSLSLQGNTALLVEGKRIWTKISKAREVKIRS